MTLKKINDSIWCLLSLNFLTIAFLWERIVTSLPNLHFGEPRFSLKLIYYHCLEIFSKGWYSTDFFYLQLLPLFYSYFFTFIISYLVGLSSCFEYFIFITVEYFLAKIVIVLYMWSGNSRQFKSIFYWTSNCFSTALAIALTLPNISVNTYIRFIKNKSVLMFYFFFIQQRCKSSGNNVGSRFLGTQRSFLSRWTAICIE